MSTHTPQLRDKVALVTGAGSGIGRATAWRLARLGASVLITDVNAVGGEETVRLCGADRASFFAADLRDDTSIDALVTAVLTAHGRLDILHSNAGQLTLVPGIDALTIADWRRSIELNLNAHFVLLKAALPALRASHGVMVVTSSSAALSSYAPGPHYAAAKYGLLGMVRSLAELVAPQQVRLNAICPTGVDSSFIVRVASDPANLLTPDDVARGVVYLATQPELTGAVLLASRSDNQLTYGWVKPYAVEPLTLPN